MARHDQKPDDRHFVCSNCHNGNCFECVDVLRMVYTDETICRCTRRGHDGEPNSQQILDPETGAVYAPGLVVSEDGEVTYNANYQ
jgi:hypothetical protein